MIPYRDTIPCRHTPWLTWSLMALNLAVHLYTQMLPPRGVQALFTLHGLVPARYGLPDWAATAGFPPDVYSPFITSMFLHGSWFHLVGNMWLLWIFGDNIEDRMGRVRFLFFYLLCGVVAAGLQVYFSPQSTVPTVGASGAIAGVMGAYFFLYPYARLVIWVFFLPLFVTVPAIAFLGAWVIFQLYKATSGFGGHAPYADVAWWGHLGGFLIGVLTHRLFLLPEREPPEETGLRRART
ncbi:rhomboid family intramembrane serine protease [Methylococcus mesophilus]|uniref:rhomboid family intramembrane serine protease n=1 Tax=Methylococcus mesophilus TaxID=2993564 RepID=UPI00224B233E|nr:rhomboid family intramembrane serine protease [Methylococcus mesophilus]UZR29319.1 rhomboid family intramembrane serine protease [Methylococcus mesophilus]